MLLLRSLAFNVLFYLNLIGRMLIFAPIFFTTSESTRWWVVKGWARSSLWLLEHVAGVRSHFTGRAKVPEGAVIIAAKHQSFWDVFAIVSELDRPTFILKKELMGIPVFGSYARHLHMIPVDRQARGGAVGSMIDGAKKAVAEGRQIVIYPEGTRTAPGAATDYRRGVYRLYEALDLEVVPVALDSGLYWPRKQIVRLPGTIDAEFLEPIKPGLAREDFLGTLRTQIETRTDEMMVKAFRRDGYLPPNEAAAKKVRDKAASDDPAD